MAVEIKGQTELDSSLKSLVATEKRLRNKGLREVGVLGAEILKNETPLGREKSSDRKWKAQRQYEKRYNKFRTFPHLQNDITISGINADGGVEIGYTEDTYWRAHFPLGTIHQAPDNFMERAEDAIAEMAMDELTRIYKEGLGL